MYGTLAGWRAYASERGNTAPTSADDAVATAALVRASDYIKYQYVSRLLPGYDETLSVVEPATYEAATLELGTVGFFTRTYTPSERTVLTGVGSISFTPVGAGSSSNFASAVPRSVLIEGMFEPYVTPREGEQAINFTFRSVG